jgi:P27 family predicted phage terminase small subunit
MPGPPPDDPQRKALRGSRRAPEQRDPVVRLAVVANIPAMPEHLGEIGRAAWDRLWTAGQAWLSPTTDLAVMERLCWSYDEREALLAEIAKIGYMVEGSTGQSRPNPLFNRLSQVEMMMLKMEQCCGFTPADRSRIGFTEVRAKTKLEGLLEARHQRDIHRREAN